jgi:hypothetical protein
MYAPPTFRPVLETLEDRTALAVDVITSAVAQPTAVATVAAPGQLASVSAIVAPTTTSLAQSTSAGVVSSSAVVQTLGTTNTTLPSVGGLPLAPPTAQIPSSFPGRIVLTGTGVQQRVAFGDGSFTQAPGQYLVGGGETELMPPVQRQPQPVPLSTSPEGFAFSIGHEQADTDGTNDAWLSAADER